MDIHFWKKIAGYSLLISGSIMVATLFVSEQYNRVLRPLWIFALIAFIPSPIYYILKFITWLKSK